MKWPPLSGVLLVEVDAGREVHRVLEQRALQLQFFGVGVDGVGRHIAALALPGDREERAVIVVAVDVPEIRIARDVADSQIVGEVDRSIWLITCQ